MREAIRSEAAYNYKSLPTKKRRSAKRRRRKNPTNGLSILWVLGAYFAYKKLNNSTLIQDRAAIDWYTLAHFFYGVIAKQSFEWSNSDILLGAIAYEIIEPPIIKWMKENWSDAGWGYETKRNIYTDILAAMAGAYLGE